MHALQRRLQRARRGRLPGMARDKRQAKENREAWARRVTERVSVGGVQMSFGGHVHKAASDQLQKKLQEEAMADGADNLAAFACAEQAFPEPAQRHGDDDDCFDAAVGEDVGRGLSGAAEAQQDYLAPCVRECDLRYA